MSALKSLMGKGLDEARDDEADGPKPASIGAQYLKRMYKHMQAGNFEKAFECLGRAQAVVGQEEEEEEDDEEDGGKAASY